MSFSGDTNEPNCATDDGPVSRPNRQGKRPWGSQSRNPRDYGATQRARRTIAGLSDYSISVVVYSIPPVKRTVMLYSQAPNAPMIKPTMR